MAKQPHVCSVATSPARMSTTWHSTKHSKVLNSQYLSMTVCCAACRLRHVTSSHDHSFDTSLRHTAFRAAGCLVGM
jgi:hypothetical protein